MILDQKLLNAAPPVVTQDAMISAWKRFGKQAVIMSYDKEDARLHEIPRQLVEAGFSIWASTGTLKVLSAHNVPARDIAEFIGSGEKFGHKVVSISTQMAMSALCNPMIEAEMAELEAAGLPFVTVGGITPYDLQSVMDAENKTLAITLARTDLGGPFFMDELVKGQKVPMWGYEMWEKVLPWILGGMEDYPNAVLDLGIITAWESGQYRIRESETLSAFKGSKNFFRY